MYGNYSAVTANYYNVLPKYVSFQFLKVLISLKSHAFVSINTLDYIKNIPNVNVFKNAWTCKL